MRNGCSSAISMKVIRKRFAPEGRLVKLNALEVVQKCKSSRSRMVKFTGRFEWG
jgi:hypothetical protein